MKSNALSKRLRHKRLALKLSLRDVERATNRVVDNSYLSNIELGRQVNVMPAILRALSEALDIHYVELLILGGHLTLRDLKGYRP